MKMKKVLCIGLSLVLLCAAALPVAATAEPVAVAPEGDVAEAPLPAVGDLVELRDPGYNAVGWFGSQLTDRMFSEFFKMAIPVVGGVVHGASTFASFKPCCDKLKVFLQNTAPRDPDAL